jgi:hypothetical protein
MISELSHLEFMLSQVGATRNGIEQTIGARSRRGGAPSKLDEFSTDELRELSTALDVAANDARAQALSADGSMSSKDAYAFFPRDPLVSIVQWAMDEYFESIQPDALVDSTRVDDGRRSRSQPVLTDLSIRGVELPTDPANRRIFGRFEVTHPKILSDPLWVWSAVAMGWRMLNGRAPFNATPPPPIKIANDARLLIVGDWGSGIRRAQNVATQMRAVLDDGISERREQWVVHLGDVYYAGAAFEYKHRFLPYWPVRDGEDIASFSINGNHDMYTGGHAYYGTCLADPRFQRQGQCSFFRMHNDHWQLLALDSSFEDGGLYGDQAGWLSEQLSDSPQLKTMLLSHHQPFSAYEPGATNMRAKLANVLDTGRIDAWFWGHEHRCLVYGPHDHVRFGSCVGHGGIPEYLVAKEGESYQEPLTYDYRKVHGDGREPWETFGFVLVDLDDAGFTATYIDEDGNRHHEAKFT